MTNTKTILIIEPSDALVQPYSYFQEFGRVVRVNSIVLGVSEIEDNPPHMVLLSASYSPESCLKVLETVKKASSKRLIPVLLVVNLAQPISFIPGTTWGGCLGILHTGCSRNEVHSTLQRIAK